MPGLTPSVTYQEATLVAKIDAPENFSLDCENSRLIIDG
jgi:hypothetical protein